jgi:hypothetical protein
MYRTQQRPAHFELTRTKDDAMVGIRVKTPHTKKRKQPDIKSIMKQLDPIRNEIKKARSGVRQKVYNEMAAALPIALVLGSNKKLQRKVLKKVASERNSGGVPVNIVTEVMVYVMGASSESGRKLAWRRGRVIEFLHSQEIKIADIAAEVKARGGINAVLKQATEESPRRKNGSTKKQKSEQKAKALLAKTSDKQDRDETEGSLATNRQNDGQVIMPILINLSDRDMLFELPAKSRVKIYATCCSQKQAKIEVSKVKKLKRDVSKPEDDDTWE